MIYKLETSQGFAKPENPFTELCKDADFHKEAIEWESARPSLPVYLPNGKLYKLSGKAQGEPGYRQSYPDSAWKILRKERNMFLSPNAIHEEIYIITATGGEGELPDIDFDTNVLNPDNYPEQNDIDVPLLKNVYGMNEPDNSKVAAKARAKYAPFETIAPTAPIPPVKDEGVEEAALLASEDLGGDALAYFLTGFNQGAIWQQTQSQRKYTEEEVRSIAIGFAGSQFKTFTTAWVFRLFSEWWKESKLNKSNF